MEAAFGIGTAEIFQALLNRWSTTAGDSRGAPVFDGGTDPRQSIKFRIAEFWLD
jgi:hypothetical protein